MEKEVKRNIASYKDLALQTVDEAKESIIASAKEKLGEMGQGNALIGKLKDMIGTSQNKRTAEAASFNGVPAKTLKESLERVSDGLLSTLSVTDECVSGESKVVNNYDKNWLMSPGVAIRPDKGGSFLIEGYFHTIGLPPAEAKRIAEKFAAFFKDSGVLHYTDTEISYTLKMASSNGFDKEKFEKLLKYMLGYMGGVYNDVSEAALEAYKQKLLNQAEQQDRETARAREAARAKGLNEGFSLTLTGDITVIQIMRAFTESYPYLTVSFFLLKDARQADKTKGATAVIPADTPLGKIRTFRGNGTVCIYGKSTPQDIEKEFREKSGLVVKVSLHEKGSKLMSYIAEGKLYKTCIYDLNQLLEGSGDHQRISLP